MKVDPDVRQIINGFFELTKTGDMAQRIFNEFSKGDTVAFWITIVIGVALFICVVILFIKYTAIPY